MHSSENTVMLITHSFLLCHLALRKTDQGRCHRQTWPGVLLETLALRMLGDFHVLCVYLLHNNMTPGKKTVSNLPCIKYLHSAQTNS